MCFPKKCGSGPWEYGPGPKEEFRTDLVMKAIIDRIGLEKKRKNPIQTGLNRINEG